MFNLTQNKWILIDDSCDENEKGLLAIVNPFYIKQIDPHSLIFCIFDLSQCNIPSIKDDDNNDKIEFIEQSMKCWAIPPLSNKAQRDYDRFMFQSK